MILQASPMIRQLTWGILPQLPTYSIVVGGKIGTPDKYETITQIIEDISNFDDLGYVEYLVYASKSGKVEDHHLSLKFGETPPERIAYFNEDQTNNYLLA